MQALTSTFLLALASQLEFVHGGGGPVTMHVCNRGFCYNKKEDFHRKSPSLQRKRGGLDVCEGGGECELYAILETELLLEAVECRVDCPPESLEQPSDTRADLQYDFETLDDLDLDLRRSWEDEPKKGSCYDDDLGYLFDCNLIKILE
jgi:hypothetical protein